MDEIYSFLKKHKMEDLYPACIPVIAVFSIYWLSFVIGAATAFLVEIVKMIL